MEKGRTLLVWIETDDHEPLKLEGEEQAPVAEMHELLCKAIHEMDFDAVSKLNAIVVDIVVELPKEE